MQPVQRSRGLRLVVLAWGRDIPVLSLACRKCFRCGQRASKRNDTRCFQDIIFAKSSRLPTANVQTLGAQPAHYVGRYFLVRMNAPSDCPIRQSVPCRQIVKVSGSNDTLRATVLTHEKYRLGLDTWRSSWLGETGTACKQEQTANHRKRQREPIRVHGKVSRLCLEFGEPLQIFVPDPYCAIQF